MVTTTNLQDAALAALGNVIDPEIRRPITELGMVDRLEVDDTGTVHVTVLLTVAACPLRNTIESDVRKALGVSRRHRGQPDRGRDERRTAVRADQEAAGRPPEPVIPFAQPGNLTQVLSVASGKGGVGKSSVTVNLALALARMGRSVGILDADIYGHSVPDLLGMDDDVRPTLVDAMIMPVPVEFEAADGAHAVVKVISMGMLKESRDQVIAWRGPILDRALTQLLSEVYWGDLDSS